ncbi:MAG: hypothetical protein AB1631_27025 [Acidobacteriota bacterium]
MRAKIFSVALCVMTVVSTSDAQSGGQQEKTQMKKEETPIMCRLDALTPQERERHLALWKRLQESHKEIREISDGYAIRFPGDISLTDIAEFISRERRCCPFFTFEIEAAGEDKPVWLRLRGGEGVKAFLKAQLGVSEGKTRD